MPLLPPLPPLPPLPARDPGGSHRASTPLELLFDLVSVIAIAAVTAGLHHSISEGHGMAALPGFGFLFLAIWWAWMNFTWFASAFANEDALYRFLTMVVMTGALVFAGGAGYIFRTLDFSWGLAGWSMMRLGMAALWLRAAGDPVHRRTARRYAAGILLAQLGWVFLYFTAAPGSLFFYLGGLGCYCLEGAVPVWAERAGRTPWYRHHIMERYGLLTIIVLGELLLSVAAGFGKLYGDHAVPVVAISAFSGIIIVFSVWWLYFTESDHLAGRQFFHTFLWGYGHVFFFGAVAVLGAGIAAESDIAGHHSVVGHDVTAWFIGAPLALAMVTLWLIRDRFHALGRRAPALPVMALAFLGAAAGGTPAWGFAILSVIAVIWRSPLRRVPGASPEMH